MSSRNPSPLLLPALPQAQNDPASSKLLHSPPPPPLHSPGVQYPGESLPGVWRCLPGAHAGRSLHDPQSPSDTFLLLHNVHLQGEMLYFYLLLIVQVVIAILAPLQPDTFPRLRGMMNFFMFVTGKTWPDALAFLAEKEIIPCIPGLSARLGAALLAGMIQVLRTMTVILLDVLHSTIRLSSSPCLLSCFPGSTAGIGARSGSGNRPPITFGLVCTKNKSNFQDCY